MIIYLGKLQSPINLPEIEATSDLEPLTFAYTPPWEEKHDYYFSENTTTPDIDPQPTSVTNNGTFFEHFLKKN